MQVPPLAHGDWRHGEIVVVDVVVVVVVTVLVVIIVVIGEAVVVVVVTCWQYLQIKKIKLGRTIIYLFNVTNGPV